MTHQPRQFKARRPTKRFGYYSGKKLKAKDGTTHVLYISRRGWRALWEHWNLEEKVIRRGYIDESGQSVTTWDSTVPEGSKMANTIGEIQKNSREKIIAQFVEWQGRPYFDIRVHIIKKTGMPIPTRKGISIDPALLTDLLVLVTEACKQNSVRDGGKGTIGDREGGSMEGRLA